MKIDYDHHANMHSTTGPGAVVEYLIASLEPKSVLDVGCGEGMWLYNFASRGVADVVGIDGVEVPQERLLFDSTKFRQMDLTQPFDLGRRFDLAVCLEVAEHLPVSAEAVLIESITRHADVILFSAACPDQPGQHHVNCRWPAHWQQHFNRAGFSCDGELRLRFWDDESIEPWYRQNLFLAKRVSSEPINETPILSLIHPEILRRGMKNVFIEEGRQIGVAHATDGHFPVSWYLTTPARALLMKLRRGFSRKKM
jgi:SAM-dependent methyltransferase